MQCILGTNILCCFSLGLTASMLAAFYALTIVDCNAQYEPKSSQKVLQFNVSRCLRTVEQILKWLRISLGHASME
jgi:hypothetical protein